jgi:transposase
MKQVATIRLGQEHFSSPWRGHGRRGCPTIADPREFRSGRELAAWLGLVPRQSSTGGKARLGGISKRGDGYLRRLCWSINGAYAVLLRSKAAKSDTWLHPCAAESIGGLSPSHWRTRPPAAGGSGGVMR